MHIITVLRLMTHINIGATLALLAWLAMHLVQCLMLGATNKTDGFLVWARHKPQRYLVVSRGFATRPRPKRRGFKSQSASNTALASQGGV